VFDRLLPVLLVKFLVAIQLISNRAEQAIPITAHLNHFEAVLCELLAELGHVRLMLSFLHTLHLHSPTMSPYIKLALLALPLSLSLPLLLLLGVRLFIPSLLQLLVLLLAHPALVLTPEKVN
jgi:hypothetical protein